jgi:nicotinate-nucleotide pyrophosphorylase
VTITSLHSFIPYTDHLTAYLAITLLFLSAGITAETLANYMCPAVDVLSCGSLTQGYACLDFSLKINRK